MERLAQRQIGVANHDGHANRDSVAAGIAEAELRRQAGKMIPTCTVLIDTYNHERYIEQAITSVLEQDFPRSEMEILVVDDGSADPTPELMRKFAREVRVLRNDNGGQASAFNAGIPQARGEIVAFLDGDDWWAKNKLSRVAETMTADAAIGLV